MYTACREKVRKHKAKICGTEKPCLPPSRLSGIDNSGKVYHKLLGKPKPINWMLCGGIGTPRYPGRYLGVGQQIQNVAVVNVHWVV